MSCQLASWSHACTVRRHVLKLDGDISNSHFSGVAPAGALVDVGAVEGLGWFTEARRSAHAASAIACVLASELPRCAAGLATMVCLRLSGVDTLGLPGVGILLRQDYSVRHEGYVGRMKHQGFAGKCVYSG